MEELRTEKVEYVKLILLNSKNYIVKVVDISKGGTNSAIVEPKEILQEALKTAAPRMIVIHNHPSRRFHTKYCRYWNDEKAIFSCKYCWSSVVRSYCYWRQMLYKYFF